MIVSKRKPHGQSAAGEHLVLFDGMCGLCSGFVQFLLRRDSRGVFCFASLQSEVGRAAFGRHGGDGDALATVVVVARHRRPEVRAWTRSDAVLFVARELGWPWSAARLAALLPKALRDAAYDLVARHRYRIFGRRAECLMPRPEFRSRFPEGE